MSKKSIFDINDKIEGWLNILSDAYGKNDRSLPGFVESLEYVCSRGYDNLRHYGDNKQHRVALFELERWKVIVVLSRNGKIRLKAHSITKIKGK